MHLPARGTRRATLGTFGLTLSVAVTAAMTAMGCGGGGAKYPDAGANFDASSDSTTKTDTGGGGGADALAPPKVGQGSTALVTGEGLLVGNGPDSCTNQDGATGDRWCAFYRPSTFLGGTDLWVINVSKVIAGTAVKCDASDLNCLLLTSTLNNASQRGPTLHRFFGDTLIYYADSGNSSSPIYAWRPGMTAARKVAAATGLNCTAHAKTDAVICFDNLTTTTLAAGTMQTNADLLAGSLASGTGTLPKIATLLIALDTDNANLTAYQVGLSAAGDWVAWSARPDPNGMETLNAQKLADPTSRVVIAPNVSQWSFSRDGAKWYWLSGYNYGLTDLTVNGAAAPPLGTLQSAKFPTDTGGAAPAPTMLRASVSNYSPAGDKGIVFFGPLSATTGLGPLSLMADSGQPTQVKSIDTAGQIIDLSNDGRTVLYAKAATRDPSGLILFDLNAGGLDLATTCVLSSTPKAVQPYGTLSDPASTVYWEYIDSVTQEFVGQYTTIAGCSSHKFSSDLVFWSSVKDQGVVFGDTVMPVGQTDFSVTLRYSAFSGAALPTTGTVVQEQAGLTFAVIPAAKAVVYNIGVGGPTDGLYVNSGLPFPTP